MTIQQRANSRGLASPRMGAGLSRGEQVFAPKAAKREDAELSTAPPLPLFVAVNAGCNLKCWYCTQHGENRSFGEGRLAIPRLMDILEAAYASGIRKFRFTGGEPTQRQNVGEILSRTQAMGDDVRVSITTNGVHLDRLVDVFPDLIEPQVFLSVDGISAASTALEDGSEFRIEKCLMDLVSVVQPVAAVRLNFVLTASTAPQLPLLIAYASERAIDIKIFELLLRDFYYSGHRPRLEVFREQYMSVRALLPELRDRYGEPAGFAGTGGRGIPMQAFSTGSSRIIFFDSSLGSHYGDVCHACPHFPCQEGLYAPVLDANGTLHPAGCVNPLLYTRLAISSIDDLRNAFRGLQAVIRGASLERALPEAISAERGVA